MHAGLSLLAGLVCMRSSQNTHEKTFFRGGDIFTQLKQQAEFTQTSFWGEFGNNSDHAAC
jgi:hypothetical protein